MAFGLQFINNSSVNQIDESTSYCLGFKSKGTITSWTSDAIANAYTATITVTGDTPMVALYVEPNVYPENPQTIAGIASATKSGSTWTIKIAKSDVESRYVEYYVFDRPANLTSGFGIMIYDSSGNPVFNGSENLAPVVTALDWGVSASTGVIQAGHKYAFVSTFDAIYQENSTESGTEYIITSRGFRTPSNAVAANAFTNEFGSGSPGYPSSSLITDASGGDFRGAAMVVDVTGL
jgi:hypothetical protein